MFMTTAGREALKWLALVLMTGDHVNKVLLQGGMPWLTDAARVVFPIFAIVLAYNLATHPDPQAARRSLSRMLLAAVLVQPFHAWAFGYWVPLNVLFSLALGLYCCTERNRPLALAAALLGGLFVDYGWCAPAIMLATMAVVRSQGRWWTWAALLVSVAGLYATNGNLYALAAFPLLLVLGTLPGRVPRWRWAFLGYYGVHLALLAVVAAV